MQGLVAGFGEITGKAVSIAGGKGASLCRMTAAGLPVPRGFVVCAAAFRAFLQRSGGVELIRDVVSGLDVHDDSALAAATEKLRGFILNTAIPCDMTDAIARAY